MTKIRINDLARELEVKSKAILDVLEEVGVTEKKTHSSSIEEHEAVKVRARFRAAAEAQTSSKPSRSSRSDADEIKTKIDLSRISKPGDVLKAITRQQPGTAAPVARPTAPHPPTETKTVTPAAKAPVTAAASAPAAPRVVVPPAARPPATTSASASAVPPAPPAAIAPPVMPPARPATQSPAAPPATAQAASPAPPSPSPAPPAVPSQAAPTMSAAATKPASPPVSQQPIAPKPRMITPQTGPRPVYKAPAPPASQQRSPQAASPASRPSPGRPVPGQPIFQRPRPAMPGGARPTLRPGERRPMHPTRQSPAGARPLGVGPGASTIPGPTRPGSRPGGPSRRPGQRYIPRGIKEGPMKGYVPPPRLVVSNEPQPITRSITITEGISVKDLAEKLGVRAKDLIARLLARGVFATINQTLDAELASEVARFFGADTNVITFEEQAAKEVSVTAASGEEGATEGVPRPPVVTIMEHVDHGKTTLLDSIRSTNVAEGEAGGITQHIGAYKVSMLDKDSPAYGREIVFLDTPGHEAFTRMRSRGAKATDIVVLVVAADDGVMPQTLEAIDHAHAAEVPIIVAVNKIDKPEAMPDRVKKQLADRDKARGISEYREQKAREATLAKSSRVSLEGLAEQIKTAGTKELNIILKGDVGGSVEVLGDLLSKLSNEKVRLKVLRSGVGAITESDVLLASASNAIIIGFNVRPERKAQELADQDKVDIRLHSIIYELQDEIKRAMTGLLEPTIKETYQGRADVKDTFRIPKVGTIAGCQVSDGLIKRDSEVRLLRDNVVVFKGKIASLRRFKDDASEVRNGMECGIAIANYSDIKVGDVIEAFVTERIAAEVIA